MNMITSVLSAFCASCVFIGALYMICPDGKISKSVKYVLSLVFLLSVIAAAGISIKKAEVSFEIPKTQETDTSALDAQTAKFVYSSILNANGISFSEITVSTDKSADGSIYISKVYIKSSEEESEILSALGEAAKNTEVEIRNE